MHDNAMSGTGYGSAKAGAGSISSSSENSLSDENGNFEMSERIVTPYFSFRRYRSTSEKEIRFWGKDVKSSSILRMTWP